MKGRNKENNENNDGCGSDEGDDVYGNDNDY